MKMPEGGDSQSDYHSSWDDVSEKKVNVKEANEEGNKRKRFKRRAISGEKKKKKKSKKKNDE